MTRRGEGATGGGALPHPPQIDATRLPLDVLADPEAAFPTAQPPGPLRGKENHQTMRILPSAALLAGSLLLASSAAAQSFQFVIDQPNSDFQWSGTTSLGDLEGNPDDTFELQGTLELSLSSGGNPVSAGQLLSMDALVVPDLSGKIPNPISWLPPLAIIDITNLRFSMSSTPFTVNASGQFNTTVVLTITSGLLTVTPLTGSPTQTDLTGEQGPPSATSRTITAAGPSLHFDSPQTSIFTFTDPGSGITGDISLVGVIVADFDCPAYSTYCTTSPNSVGPGVLIGATGSTSITANDLVLTGTGAPLSQFGLFYFGPNQISVPFGEGVRCAGGGIVRLGVSNSGGTGVFTKALDHTALAPGNEILAGETQNFQCWYRDPSGGPSGFNFSDGLEVFFCP